MTYVFEDKETGIKHLRADDLSVCLCGLLDGWTEPEQEPVKERYGTTCVSCIEVIKEIKALKLK